jgi:large-conductance mechanosensitive channel
MLKEFKEFAIGERVDLAVGVIVALLDRSSPRS